MIIYFSGTGNSAYVARSLANLLGEEVVFIPKSDSGSLQVSGERIIFCFPIYSWGVPPLVLDYIERLGDDFVNKVRTAALPVIMVCTCGDDVALAPEMFESAWRQRGVSPSAIWSVQMPNDYVLLPGFDVDSTEVEQQKLDESASRIREIASRIERSDFMVDVVRGKWTGLKSKIIYPLFRRWGISPRKWRATEECVHCGRCAAACPVENIRMVSGVPNWGSRCVSCTSCYHHCPAHAVEYGSATRSKGQYFCHLVPMKSTKN